MNDPTETLRIGMFDHALRYPATSEDLACAGTPIEARTVKVGKRAFLFLRDEDARFKASASLARLKELAARWPERYEAADNGWVKVTFANGAAPELDDAKRWIDESYRIMANKTHTKLLDASPLV